MTYNLCLNLCALSMLSFPRSLSCKHSSWTAEPKLSPSVYFFSVSSLSSDWEALRSPFCDHCTYYCVWASEGRMETKRKIAHFPVWVVTFFLFATALLWFSPSCLLPVFFLWNPPQRRKYSHKHKRLHSSTYCVHTQTGVPVGRDTETKTHTSTAQCEPSHGSLVIPTVPLCVFVFVCWTFWLHSHPSTFHCCLTPTQQVSLSSTSNADICN